MQHSCLKIISNVGLLMVNLMWWGTPNCSTVSPALLYTFDMLDHRLPLNWTFGFFLIMFRVSISSF